MLNKNLKGRPLFSNPLGKFFSLTITSKIVIMEIKVVFSDLRTIPLSKIQVPCFKPTAEKMEVLSRSVEANSTWSIQNFTKITV
jgi:hypothetical protein